MKMMSYEGRVIHDLRSLGERDTQKLCDVSMSGASEGTFIEGNGWRLWCCPGCTCKSDGVDR